MGLNLKESNSNNEIIDKTYINVSKSFSTNKIPLRKIYMLQRGKELKIVDLKPLDSFIELIKNTFGIDRFSNTRSTEKFLPMSKYSKTD